MINHLVAPSLRMVALSVAISAPLFAQSVADRGALAIRSGNDTVVVDRFIRTADTLKGTVQVKGQPRIDYLALLGPNDRVRVLLLGVFAPGAAPDAAPIQRIRMTVQGDTVVAETPSGTQRMATTAGAIPMFNNALALSELFTRRARAAGGTADVPYFAINGGTTLTVAVRPATADTLTVSIATQVQRFRVDPAGRILGGVVAGTPFEFVRLGAEAANGLNVMLRLAPD